MICENCKIEHSGEYGSGRFCSAKCARSFSTKNKRKEIKRTKARVVSAKKEYSDFGMYDDCGDAYRDWLEEAKIKHDIAIAFRVTFVVSSEKYFKKLRHFFLEKYPSFDWLLNEHIERAIKNHIEMKNGKT